MVFDRITVDADQMGDMPCDTRHCDPRGHGSGMVADDGNVGDPRRLPRRGEDISQALRYAAEAVQERALPSSP